jgi:5'-deoxynucleotidase YfbR-like HD superfamily hydrolase
MRSSLLFDNLPEERTSSGPRRLRPEDVERDVGAIIWSIKLQHVRRYFHQRFWENESIAAQFADKIEPDLKLENVAAHSWHVSDIALLIADQFAPLNLERCLSLAIIHDKLEIITGDYDPLGAHGDGRDTHAFSAAANLVKLSDEINAMRSYCGRLKPKSRPVQQALFEELFSTQSRESRFIKAIDKLQCLAFIYCKKDGEMDDKHIEFTIRYAAKALTYFPEIKPYYDCLVAKIFSAVSRRRNCTTDALRRSIAIEEQLQLEFDL